MQAAKQMRLSRNARRSAAVRSSRSSKTESIHLKQNSRLAGDRGDVLHRGERRRPLLLVGHVGVEQGEVELHVDGLLEQLPRQVEPPFRRVHVLVQVEYEVVRHDRVPGGEERDEPGDQVPLRRGQLGQVGQVRVQVYLLHRPGVLDRVAEPVVERRVAHRPQGQVHAGVEQAPLAGLPGRAALGRGHWHASQVSGFSSEQATAASGAASAAGALTATVACCIRVAGRERR